MKVNFSFDNLDILGVFGNKVHLRGSAEIDEEKDNVECVIVLDKKLFHKTLDAWLAAKKKYCESWNHYCGQMGRVYSTETKNCGTIKLLTEENCRKGIYDLEDVPLIEMLTFDPEMDMEHG